MEHQREADGEDHEDKRAERRAGARPWRKPPERGADGENDGAEHAHRRRHETTADADQHTRHDDEEGVEHGDRRVDAAGDPRRVA